MRLSRDSRATVARQSRDIHESVSRHSRESNLFSCKFVRQSRDIRVARHSYECRLVLFSRQIVARFSQDCRATVVRHSRDIRTSVVKISHCKFAKISRRQVRDNRTNVARPSRDSLAKYFGEKIRIQFFNMLKNFATSSSQHKKILTTLARMSCESPRQNSQNARNSHASEILALLIKSMILKYFRNVL